MCSRKSGRGDEWARSSVDLVNGDSDMSKATRGN